MPVLVPFQKLGQHSVLGQQHPVFWSLDLEELVQVPLSQGQDQRWGKGATY